MQVLRRFNEDISEVVRKDTRTYNTKSADKVIEENESLKFLRQEMVLGRKDIYKIRNKKEQTVSSREDILDSVEPFFRELHQKQHQDMTNTTKPIFPKLLDIRKAPVVLKNKKTLREAKIAIDTIYLGEQ